MCSTYIRLRILGTIENMRSQSAGRSYRSWIFAEIGTLVPLIPFFYFISALNALGKENGEGSFTGLGAGIITQRFEISRLVERPRVGEGTYFLKKREQESALVKINKSYLPLSWTLGAGFTLLSTPALGTIPEINDTVFFLSGGLDWTPFPTFNITLDLNIDSIGAENYNHGAFLFKFWKTFSLHPKAPDQPPVDYDGTEAGQFYERQLTEKQKALALKRKAALVGEDEIREEEEKEAQPFPKIKMGILLGFGEHLVAGKVYRQPRRQALTEEQRLFQNQMGAEFVYLPREGVDLSLGVNVFLYSSVVDSYLSYLEMGTLQRVPLFAKTGWAGSTNQMLSLPAVSIDQALEIQVSEREKLGIFINESVYASIQQNVMISLTPSYLRNLGKGWKVGLYPFLGLILNSGLTSSGMIQFGYDF